MATKAPQKTIQLATKMYGVWITNTHKTSKRVPRTSLLFAVTDFDWTAFYAFVEESEAFEVALRKDVARKSKGHQVHLIHYAIAKMTASKDFRPNKPLAVNQFADGTYGKGPNLWDSGIARANLKTLPLVFAPHLHLKLTVFLRTGPENLPLYVHGDPHWQQPSRHETGRVVHLATERFKPGTSNDASRFSRLFLPTIWNAR